MSQVISEPQALVRFERVEACPVCDSEDHSELFTSRDELCGFPGEFEVAQCSQCELVYLQTRPDAKSLGQYYPSDSYYSYKPPASYSLFRRNGPLPSLWYAIKKGILAYRYGYSHLGGSRALAMVGLRLLPLRNWATFELDVLLHPYVEGGSLLEIGCGSGMYLDLMRALGWRRVVGVDIGVTAIQQAKDVLDIEAYCGSLEEAQLDSNSFDAVSLSHTLEHIPEAAEFLREVYRVTKPGGRLAVIVPNIASCGARKFGADWFHLDSPRHAVNFNRRSLSMALERAGFRVETLKTIPRMAYQTALFSMVRKAGGDRAVYTDSTHRFPIHRRARALALSMIERMQCAIGLPAGEELTAVAVKPV